MKQAVSHLTNIAEHNLGKLRELFYQSLFRLGLNPRSIKKLQMLEKVPRLLFNEFAFQVGLIDDPERDVMATHEAGHALVAFLIDEKSVVSINLLRIHSKTQMALYEGFDLYKESGNVHSEYDEGMMDNIDLANLHLAGLANEMSQSLNNQSYHTREDIMNKFDENDTWGDLDVPYRIIFEKSGGQITNDEVHAIFFEWLAKLTELFKTEKFQKALNIIKEIALQPDPGIPTHECIRNRLLENGFTESELREMKERVKTCATWRTY